MHQGGITVAGRDCAKPIAFEIRYQDVRDVRLIFGYQDQRIIHITSFHGELGFNPFRFVTDCGDYVEISSSSLAPARICILGQPSRRSRHNRNILASSRSFEGE